MSLLYPGLCTTVTTALPDEPEAKVTCSWVRRTW